MLRTNQESSSSSHFLLPDSDEQWAAPLAPLKVAHCLVFGAQRAAGAVAPPLVMMSSWNSGLAGGKHSAAMVRGDDVPQGLM